MALEAILQRLGQKLGQTWRSSTPVTRAACRMLGLVLAVIAGHTNALPAVGQEAAKRTLEPGYAKMLNLGGRLYDNHWSVLGRTVPSGLNPLYPANSAAARTSTWRCVTCHGWDYAGSAGHLRRTTGSAAFVGLSSVIGRHPKKLVQFLRSSSHRVFISFMPDDAINALGLFLSHGQHDFKVLTGAKGDPRRGKDIYEGVCIRCHEADGTAPIYGEKGDRSSLAWIARNRPEQAIHKIRNGVPNADMVEMRFLDLQSMNDLLVYLQSLDKR